MVIFHGELLVITRFGSFWLLYLDHATSRLSLTGSRGHGLSAAKAPPPEDRRWAKNATPNAPGEADGGHPLREQSQGSRLVRSLYDITGDTYYIYIYRLYIYIYRLYTIDIIIDYIWLYHSTPINQISLYIYICICNNNQLYTHYKYIYIYIYI